MHAGPTKTVALILTAIAAYFPAHGVQTPGAGRTQRCRDITV
jgi:hypothetical protein